MKKIIQNRKCPECKKNQKIEGTMEMGFFSVGKNPCYLYPYCSKKCFEKAKREGRWK
jgi:hypothetical protein